MSAIKKILFGLCVLLCAAACFYFFQKQTWLSLYADNGTGKEMVYMAYLPEESRFCVRFKHSVALTPVEEWFVAKNGNVTLRSTVYEDFGAGLPHDVEEGREMEVVDGKVVITGYSLSMHAMYVRVGRVAEHELIVEKKQGVESHRVRLDTLANAGTAIKFSIVKDSMAHALWRHWRKVYL